jgi:hypothetical protein
MNITNIIKSGLENIDSLSIKLTPNEITFLQNLLKNNPAMFEEINIICADNKIDSKDIPHIVIILSNIYQQNLISSNINVNIINIIEFTITILIQMTPMPAVQSQILLQVLSFSIELLRMQLPNIEIIEKKIYDDCNSCCYKSFRCCYKK